MTSTQTTDSERPFRVIEGGGACAVPQVDLAPLTVPEMSAAELAAEMAEIFAMSLLRKQRLADLQDPHCKVRVDAAFSFTLHELLCELRSLAWCDAGQLPARDLSATAQERRALRWNGEGQLTLNTLFRGGVASMGAARLSALWQADHAVADRDPAQRPPHNEAPMSAWLEWCGRHSGAGLCMPGDIVTPEPRLQSLDDMAERLHHLQPARPFHNATLAALANGATFDGGLCHGDTPWRGGRLMSLMAQAEGRATRATLMQARAPGRLPRPGVTAARMTVWLAREERGDAPSTASVRAAADELAAASPNLLHWVSRTNASLRQKQQRFQNSLFLPLVEADRQYMMASDCAPHLAVAGAMATLMKAVFDTARPVHFQGVGTQGSAMDMAQEADMLVANMSLARVVSGGYHPVENLRDLRAGEMIALHLLRDMLEADNRPATLDFTGFDGKPRHIVAQPRQFGRGVAKLYGESGPLPWSQEEACGPKHLMAIV